MNGRVDLWLADETREELVEAKFKWVRIGSAKNEASVESTIQSALRDAKLSRCTGDTKAFGLGFFPVYKNGNHVRNIDELIEKTIAEFLSFDYHALAWCFPKETRNYRGEMEGNLLPGVFMLVKNVDC